METGADEFGDGDGTYHRASGFKVEFLRSAAAEKVPGWRWRLIRVGGSLSRGKIGVCCGSRSGSALPFAVETINTNLLECRGLLFAHGALYANANNSKGLFRFAIRWRRPVRGGADSWRLRPAELGHGRNQLALGPDGLIYSIHGDDVGLPHDRHVSTARRCVITRRTGCCRASGTSICSMPARQCRSGISSALTPTGGNWELVAGGLRNPYGIDFDETGDLFTFDADMEWDAGCRGIIRRACCIWCRAATMAGDAARVCCRWSPDTLPTRSTSGLARPPP